MMEEEPRSRMWHRHNLDLPHKPRSPFAAVGVGRLVGVYMHWLVGRKDSKQA